jgi:hypothetical protein
VNLGETLTMEMLKIPPQRMLRGHAEIGKWLRLSRCQVDRYRRNEAAPIFRFGTHIVTCPEWWLPWFAARERHRAARKAARTI